MSIPRRNPSHSIFVIADHHYEQLVTWRLKMLPPCQQPFRLLKWVTRRHGPPSVKQWFQLFRIREELDIHGQII
jgi:hypothetical protein